MDMAKKKKKKILERKRIFLKATQNNSIRTSYVKVKIDNTWWIQ